MSRTGGQFLEVVRYVYRFRLKRLQELSDRYGGSEQLAELTDTLDHLYESQWWIEEVAQTPGNEPAPDLLLRDIEPVEESITRAIDSLVYLERKGLPGASRTAFGYPEVRQRWQ